MSIGSSEPGVPEATGSGARHRAREVALQVLYAIDLGVGRGEGDAEAEAEAEDPASVRPLRDPIERGETAFERVTENFSVPHGARAFARQLVAAVTRHAEELDELLGAHARNWRVSRMAAVDRNVLRMAIYELRDTETPVAVVIDEAVDLARRFGSDASPAFVNGVLDAVAREVRAA